MTPALLAIDHAALPAGWARNFATTLSVRDRIASNSTRTADRLGALPVAILFALFAVALAGCAGGGNVVPDSGRQFQLVWQVTKETRGAIVRGQIGNPYAVPARDIHLLVEGLDAGGSVVTTMTSVVRRIVLSGDRAPFEILVPGDASRYRVSVVTFDLVLPRGGR